MIPPLPTVIPSTPGEPSHSSTRRTLFKRLISGST